jgi:hypothetical protein
MHLRSDAANLGNRGRNMVDIVMLLIEPHLEIYMKLSRVRIMSGLVH